jgi:DNA-binding NtrC family response regulator
MMPIATGRSAEILGASEPIRRVKYLVHKLGASQIPVLLFGESGTGKEVAARAIYEVKKEGPFVPIDCGALPAHLVESELFGHERGAYTGAHAARSGLLQAANGGTAFFDEIGELPLETQVKLLRVLQEKVIRPVGSNRSQPCNFRILAATNRNLKEEVQKGRFRLDLYYRLDVVSLELPPLRKRRDDIPLLFEHFLKPYGCSYQPNLLDELSRYGWPGNVRELKNCVDRLVALACDQHLSAEDLPFRTPFGSGISASGDDGLYPELSPFSPAHRIPPGRQSRSLADAERDAIEQALAAAGGSRSAAAKSLRIGRTTLYRKLKEHAGP